MQVGRRFRIYPTRSQAGEMRRWMGGQRFVFNAKIEKYRYEAWLRRHAILSPSWSGPDPARERIFDQGYAAFRGNNPWMAELPAEVFRNGCYRYRKAVIAAASGAGAPTIKHRSGPQSVLLTSELFAIEGGRFFVASRKQDLGEIEWVAHREFAAPKMVSISAEPDGRWFVGFSFEDGVKPPEAAFPQSEGEVLGVDLGIVQAAAASDGRVFHPSPEATAACERHERKARKLQRKLARQKKGSRKREATKRRIARLRSRQANARRDFAHKTSRALCDGPHKAIAFEALRLKNMTAAPAPRPNERGGYDPNGAAAKAGLNSALLGRSLGLIRQLTQYKAAAAGKSFACVPASYSSQTCHKCGHVSPLNRPSQAEFICQACGADLNADLNAALVIAQRGLVFLYSVRNGQLSPVERASRPRRSRKPPPSGGG